MTGLVAALTEIHKGHSVASCSDSSPTHFVRWAMCETCGWESERLPATKIAIWDETFRELYASHVAALQTAYLREHLTDHAEELGMTRESKLRLRGDGHWSEDFRHLTNWSRDDHP